MPNEKYQRLEKELDMPLKVGFMKLSEHAIIPTKAHATDSGFDLYAAEDVIIAPGETKIIKTNIAVLLPDNHEAQVRPRSGITSRTKLRVNIGTIDNAYRGDIGIIIDNIKKKKKKKKSWTVEMLNGIHKISDDYLPKGCYLIQKGDKIAQLVIQPLPYVEAVEVFELDSTERGENGFGSSGT